MHAQQQRAQADQELVQMSIRMSRAENLQKDEVWKLQAKYDVQMAGTTSLCSHYRDCLTSLFSLS